jgi:DNA helicase-2/ATP-dependent DNA helicase PcrA
MHSLGFNIVKEKPRDVGLRKANLQVQNNESIKKLIYRDAALILGYNEDDSKEALKCKQCGDCRETTEVKKCKICRKYWEIMSKCNYIDFDDQILFACQILEKNPDMLEQYQSQAKHLLVDEYQDINAAQFRLIALLSRKSRDGLFVVGDDAQSIYGFRGTDPKFILRFGKDFPDAETLPLAYSRRCHDKIMNDAFKVLDKYYPEWNGNRELEYFVESGEDPFIWHLPSNIAEAKKVAQIARSSIQNGKTILILAPKKEFFPLLSEYLSKYKVPHRCPINLLHERTRERIGVVKRFIDWLTDPTDSFKTRLVIEDLINIGIAKIPGASKITTCKPETIKKRIAGETEIANLWESVDKKTNLFSVINNYENLGATLLKIRESLNNLIGSYDDFKGDNRGEFVKRLSVVSGIWIDPANFTDDISSIVKLLDSKRPTGVGSVELMTMRKAKGLEAQIVVIVGLEDDVVPSRFSDEVEEARLFYVSMTRAKERLYLLHSFQRPRNISYGQELRNKKRSRFLDTIGRDSEYKGFRKK